MRTLQIIDSLEAGGAERMAVNYANALAANGEFSALAVTRREGPLKTTINTGVTYIFVEKTTVFDLQAARRLKQFCRSYRIEMLHAHSSSYFIALLTKVFYPQLKIVWHDHNGMSEFLGHRPNVILKTASRFFSGIIVVNHLLKQWAEAHLSCKKVAYLPNFTAADKHSAPEVQLNGIAGKRVLCLANLRPQKDHFLLLSVAAKLRTTHPEWTFHLVGKDFGDDYSRELRGRIADLGLEDSVFLYGTLQNTAAVIRQAEIAVITSISEGLPVSLLEYGAGKKAVVTTKVGEIPAVIRNGENGFMVTSQDSDKFCDALLKLIGDDELRTSFGKALYKTVNENYSAEAVISQYKMWLKEL